MGLSNSQYEAVMRGYARRQTMARARQAEKRQEIDSKVPELRRVERELVELSAAEARSRLLGTASPENSAENKKRREELIEEKKILLASAGFSERDLEIVPECPDCQDTGYIGSEKCHCFRQAEIDLLYAQSSLKDVLQKENFKAFSLAYYPQDRKLPGSDISCRQQIGKVLEECRRALENCEKKPVNILFTGPAGSGKTFLTHCMAAELMNRCKSVVYLSSIDFFEQLEGIRFGSDRDFEERRQENDRLLGSDVLIIDDLGTEIGGTFTSSQLFYCLNERLVSGKSTIISTNLSLNAMRDRYTERVTSRLISDYAMLEVYTDDIRIQKRLKG